jgi:hypothetical protein
MVLMKVFRAWFCLIIYLLVWGGIQRAVFCVGANGHSHIEVGTAGDTSCNRSAHAGLQRACAVSELVSGAVPPAPFATDHCITCVHVPILVGAPDHNPPPDGRSLLTQISLGEGPLVDILLSEGTASQTTVPEYPVAGGFVLTSLRSVVLVI